MTRSRARGTASKSHPVLSGVDVTGPPTCDWPRGYTAAGWAACESGESATARSALARVTRAGMRGWSAAQTLVTQVADRKRACARPVLRSDLSSVGAPTVVVPGDYDEGSAGGRVGDWPEGADASHAGSRCVPAEPRRIRADVPPWRATDGRTAARGLRRAVAGAMARAEVHGPTTVAIGLLGASPVAHRSSSDSPEGLEWPEDEAAAAVVTGILEWAATQGRSSIAQVLETCAQIES